MANMQQALKQIQKMQAEMKRVQDELAVKTVTKTAGGGVVAVEISGALEVKKVTIEPEALEDKEMLEDLLVAAVNEAIKEAQELSANEMAKVTGNLKLPGLPGGLF
ncbi:MAG: YbaB/EbfC family nucleoid-associated protein [Firmicutes bacterium]|nr:YbaB/EbfC family nucleoid-associated protein [Bacillota bacterium]